MILHELSSWFSLAKRLFLALEPPREWLRPAALTGFCLVAVGTSFAQARQVKPGLGSVHGTVTTTQDNVSTALADIAVRLSPPGPGGISKSADSDEAGRFEITDIEPGSYTVFVALAGFKPFRK